MVFLFFQGRLEYFYSIHSLHFQYFIITFKKIYFKKEKYGSYEADMGLPVQPWFGAVLEIRNYLLSKRTLLLYDTLNISLRNPLIKKVYCFRLELVCGLNHCIC